MQALVHLKPLILKPCRCHLKLGICIKASDAAVLWDHEHTTDKTVKVFIFGAKEWCRSIFDIRKIFVASRDLFVIDPLNLFTHKSYRRGRIRMQYELYIFRAYDTFFKLKRSFSNSLLLALLLQIRNSF